MKKAQSTLAALGALALLNLAAFSLAAPSPAQAGIPECGNLRLDGVSNCTLEANVECNAGCERLGIYKVACATRLETVCRSECTLSAMPTCSDSCTVMCQAECDAGVSITCQHNCFGECAGVCTETCADATDPATCRASCEATCDGECDIQCAPVLDETCYVHCVECCGGSCTAQANMDCQVNCQEVEFEDCEREIQADCSASCSGDGALFCDGEYVISGSQVPACITALAERGIMVEAEGSIMLGPDGLTTDSSFCSTTPGRQGTAFSFVFLLLGATGLLFARRRR